MELVTIVQIELPRLNSSQSYAFSASVQREGMFVVADGEVATVKEVVLKFAEQCGANRTQLQSLRQVSGHRYTSDSKVIVFDIDTPNVQFSTAYALCKTHSALKIGERFFELSEIPRVSSF